MTSWGAFFGVGLTVLGVIVLVSGIVFAVMLTDQIHELEKDMEDYKANYSTHNSTAWDNYEKELEEANGQKFIYVVLIVGGIASILAGIGLIVFTVVSGIMANKKMEEAWRGGSTTISSSSSSPDADSLGPAAEYSFSGGDKGFDDF